MEVKKIVHLNWVDSGEAPDWADSEAFDWCCLEEESISFYDETYSVSFSNAVKSRSGNGGISPGIEKFYYHTQKWAAPLNIFLLIFLLIMTSGYFVYSNKVKLIEEELKRMDRQITALAMESSLNVPPAGAYQNIIGFIKDLSYCKNSPSYLDVMKNVSDGLSANMETEIVKIEYSANAMILEIFGRIQAAFDSAQKGFQQFISYMKSKGYNITESRFDTNIRHSKFLVKFTKRIG